MYFDTKNYLKNNYNYIVKHIMCLLYLHDGTFKQI